jgi:hypothetical protein
MMRIAPEQGIPVTARAVDLFKTFFAPGLDFELPED